MAVLGWENSLLAKNKGDRRENLEHNSEMACLNLLLKLKTVDVRFLV